MLKNTKWKNQDPEKVIQKKNFQEWLMRKLKKAAKNYKEKE